MQHKTDNINKYFKNKDYLTRINTLKEFKISIELELYMTSGQSK